MSLARTIIAATTVFSIYLMALGCDQGAQQADSMDSLAFVEAELMVIDGDTTAALAAHETVLVDLTQEEMVYAIDLADPTLDVNRIMVREGDNDSFMLNQVLEVEVPEQGYDQSELDRIVLTANPENYGTLDAAELNELAAIGTVVQETEVYNATGEFAQKSGEIKVLLEIYWENKKGKFRCIRIGASKGFLATAEGEGETKEDSKKEANFVAADKKETDKEEATDAEFAPADKEDSKQEDSKEESNTKPAAFSKTDR
jgi:hypothetical protein